MLEGLVRRSGPGGAPWEEMSCPGGAGAGTLWGQGSVSGTGPLEGVAGGLVCGTAVHKVQGECLRGAGAGAVWVWDFPQV